MNDALILLWIQSFGSGFRHNDGFFYIDWLCEDGTIRSTKGRNIRAAVVAARLERDALYELNERGKTNEQTKN